jgi:Holliday junction DNA helicase RuvA
MASRTLLSIGKLGDDVTIHTWLSVRETELTLFGFESAAERKLFQLLQTVSGVGPRLALGTVGTLGVKTVVDAISTEDAKTISQAPGVGPKVAQRIVLELNSKIEEFAARLGTRAEPVHMSGRLHEEVRAILEGLGYTGTEVNMALGRAKDEDDLGEDVESLVRYSLKVLGAASLT